jgi:electron transfer flavoprotein beta subunit
MKYKKMVMDTWDADELEADMDMLGLEGSPTKVKKIDNVVLIQKENKRLSASEQDIKELMQDLSNDHIL